MVNDLILRLPIHENYTSVCLDKSSDELRNYFPVIQKIIIDAPQHKRIGNYRDLNRIIEDSTFVSLVFDNQKRIIGFSTVMEERWGGELVRVLSRTFYSKSHRSNSLKAQTFPNIATAFMLPDQVAVCVKLGYRRFFISFEYHERRNYIKSVFDELNLNWRFGQWKLADSTFNVCPRLKSGEVNQSEACWQSIVYLDLGESFLEEFLPRKQI